MFAPLPVPEDKSEIHSGVRCQFCVTDSLLSCMSPTDGWHSFCIPSHVTVIPFYYSSFPVTPQSMNEAAPLPPNTWPSADLGAVFLFRLEPISWANDQHRSLNAKMSNVNLADKRSMMLGHLKKNLLISKIEICVKTVSLVARARRFLWELGGAVNVISQLKSRSQQPPQLYLNKYKHIK